MNRKGFTLAELLGVVVILGIIGLVAITTIDGRIREGRIKTCKSQETNLIEAAKIWAIDYPPTNSETQVTIKTLRDDGYIEDDLKNPMTNELYDNNTKIIISTTNGSYYTYNVVYNSPDKACE